MKIKCLFLLMIFLPLVGIHCDNFSNDPKPEDVSTTVDLSHFTVQNYPRVDGSTSTHPLQIVIACKILDIPFKWFLNFMDGTLGPRPSEPDASGKDKIALIDSIKHNGTHGAWVNLIEQKTDLILVARAPSKDEIRLADSLGVSLEYKPVALDAFVFILNVENPVNNLTLTQIRQIYTGNILNWQEVGGNNVNIHPYQRNRNSGSQELMETLVMQGLPMMEVPDMFNLWSMMGPINKLVDDPFGICYTVYFFNEYIAPRDAIKLSAINGIFPDRNNIQTRKYPLVADVYAAIRSGLDPQSHAFLLWKWLGTRKGQETVAESGYIPLF